MIAKYLDKAIPFGHGYRTEATVLGIAAVFLGWWLFVADFHAWINYYTLPILHETGPYIGLAFLAARVERKKNAP